MVAKQRVLTIKPAFGIGGLCYLFCDAEICRIQVRGTANQPQIKLVHCLDHCTPMLLDPGVSFCFQKLSVSRFDIDG